MQPSLYAQRNKTKKLLNFTRQRGLRARVEAWEQLLSRQSPTRERDKLQTVKEHDANPAY